LEQFTKFSEKNHYCFFIYIFFKYFDILMIKIFFKKIKNIYYFDVFIKK
jgi:hypothetical protein